MLQCTYLLYLSFSLGGFGRLYLLVNHSSSTSALASRGQNLTSARFFGLSWLPLSFFVIIGLGMGLKPNTKDGCISLALWPHNVNCQYFFKKKFMFINSKLFGFCMLLYFQKIKYWVNFISPFFFFFFVNFILLSGL